MINLFKVTIFNFTNTHASTQSYDEEIRKIINAIYYMLVKQHRKLFNLILSYIESITIVERSKFYNEVIQSFSQKNYLSNDIQYIQNQCLQKY